MKAICPDCGSTELSIAIHGRADYNGKTGNISNEEWDENENEIECQNCGWEGDLDECETAAKEKEEQESESKIKYHPNQEKLFEL